jgi:hypothetical protein
MSAVDIERMVNSDIAKMLSSWSANARRRREIIGHHHDMSNTILDNGDVSPVATINEVILERKHDNDSEPQARQINEIVWRLRKDFAIKHGRDATHLMLHPSDFEAFITPVISSPYVYSSLIRHEDGVVEIQGLRMIRSYDVKPCKFFVL